MIPDLDSIFQDHRAKLQDGGSLVLKRELLGAISVPSGRLAVAAVHQDLRELVSAKVPAGTYSVEGEVAEDRLVAVVVRVTAAAPERWEPRWTLPDEPLLVADRSLLVRAEEKGADWKEDWIEWAERTGALAQEFSVAGGRLVAARSAFRTIPIVYVGFRGAAVAAVAVTCGELEGEDWEFENGAEADYRCLLPRSALLASLGKAVNDARKGNLETLFRLADEDVLVVQCERSFGGRKGLEELLKLLPPGPLELRAPLFPEAETVSLSLAVLPRASRVLGEIEITGFDKIKKVVLPEAFAVEDKPAPARTGPNEGDRVLVSRLAKVKLSPLQAVFFEDIQRTVASGGMLTEGQRKNARDLLCRLA